MATENDFNSYFTTHVNRMGTRFKGLKISDKLKTGISDFILFYEGRALAIESKHIQEWPPGKGRALKHPVSGPQQTFLKGMGLAGVPGYVMVACAVDRVITVIPAEFVPPSGNWTKEELFEARRLYGAYGYMEIPRLVSDLFRASCPLAEVG